MVRRRGAACYQLVTNTTDCSGYTHLGTTHHKREEELMSRCSRGGLALGLMAVALIAIGIATATPAPDAARKGPLGGELTAGEKYGFIIGSGGEAGYYGKVLAIDGGWVKVETYRLRVQGRIDPMDGAEKAGTLWLNLSQVVAVRKKPPESVWLKHKPPAK